MRLECRERFPRHRELAVLTWITASVTHVPWSLISSFLWSRWRGKRYWHSRLKHNPQFYISGRRPMDAVICLLGCLVSTECHSIVPFLLTWSIDLMAQCKTAVSPFIADTLEILQSCTEPSNCNFTHRCGGPDMLPTSYHQSFTLWYSKTFSTIYKYIIIYICFIWVCTWDAFHLGWTGVFKHIEAETKWTAFRRWHFQVHFREWKCLNSD